MIVPCKGATGSRRERARGRRRPRAARPCRAAPPAVLFGWVGRRGRRRPTGAVPGVPWSAARADAPPHPAGDLRTLGGLVHRPAVLQCFNVSRETSAVAVSYSWHKGSTRSWRKVRALVLARDGYLCQVQINGVCTITATCVHHTVGRSVSRDDPAYLVASCGPCNRRVNDPAQVADHHRVVSWARANEPTTLRALACRFPEVTPNNLHTILTRAKRRGELVRSSYGVYRAGPTGLPPRPSEPAPRSATNW